MMPNLADLPAAQIKATGGRLRGSGYRSDAPVSRRRVGNGTEASEKQQNASSISATSMRYLQNRSWGTSALNSGPGVSLH